MKHYYPVHVWFVFEDDLNRVRAITRLQGQGYIWLDKRNGWLSIADDTIVRYLSRSKTGVYDRGCSTRKIFVRNEEHFRRLYEFYNSII